MQNFNRSERAWFAKSMSGRFLPPGVCLALCLTWCGARADIPSGLPTPPLWYKYEVAAYDNYLQGMSEAGSDPQQAVKDLTRAEQFVGLALRNGGGVSATQMARGIAQALQGVQDRMEQSSHPDDSSAANSTGKPSNQYRFQPKTNIQHGTPKTVHAVRSGN